MDLACLESVIDHYKLKEPVSLGIGAGDTEPTAFVLMEVENAALDECSDWLAEIFDLGLVTDGVMAQNDREAKELWHYREGVAESILAGHDVHQEDVSVPVASLSDFYAEIHTRYAKAFPVSENGHELSARVFFFGHIGDGNLHIFIQGPKTTSIDSPARAKFLTEAKAVDHELFAVLQNFKGSVSAEHGIGILKLHALHFTRTPQEMALMRGLKQVFDPRGLLNPGKLLS